jgi:hypothetical protein
MLLSVQYTESNLARNELSSRSSVWHSSLLIENFEVKVTTYILATLPEHCMVFSVPSGEFRENISNKVTAAHSLSI